MANPTTYFGWVMPTSSSLVTNLPADFNTFGQGVDTSLQDLLGGTTGQVLSKTSGTNMDFTWVTPTDQTPLTTKGDLFTFTTVDARLGVGTNGYILSANSATATGLEWIAANPGDITGVTAGTGISGGGTSGTVTVSIDTAVTADLTTAQTLTNKTLTAPIITSPKISSTYSAKTAAYTFADGDQGNIFSMNNAATQQFNIPTDATFNFAVGTEINVFWITGAGQPTIGAVTPGTTTVISTGATSATPKLRAANSGATCKKLAANSWIVFGDLA